MLCWIRSPSTMIIARVDLPEAELIPEAADFSSGGPLADQPARWRRSRIRTPNKRSETTGFPAQAKVDKKNGMISALVRSIKKAETKGTMMKA